MKAASSSSALDSNHDNDFRDSDTRPARKRLIGLPANHGNKQQKGIREEVVDDVNGAKHLNEFV